MSIVIPERAERKYEPYPEYKDSGVEWLGQIPSHWDIRKLKQISSAKVSSVDKHSKEDEKPVFLCNYTDVYNKDTILLDNGFMEATATDNEIALFSLKQDDVIITKDSEDWKDIAVPSYVSTDLPGVICGYHLALIHPELITGRFLFWSFYARNINHQFAIASTGITRFGLVKYWLDNSLFFIPPIDEQRSIADFLDRETARMDEMIARKQRLIELLHEQRTALITCIVTKGLSSDVPMKDSGVEWLGEIPANWEVKKLKYVAEIITGNTPPKSDPENYDELEGLPWIKPDNLGSFLPVSVSQEYLSAKGAALARIVPKETILTCCIGSIGSIGIAGCELSTNQQINSVVFSDQRVHHKYGFYMVYSSLPEYRKLANLNVVAIINSQSQKTIPMPLPPLPEQQTIADYLDQETARIDNLVGRINQAIEKLQEYRSALITAAVTGKIDVRQHVS